MKKLKSPELQQTPLEKATAARKEAEAKLIAKRDVTKSVGKPKTTKEIISLISNIIQIILILAFYIWVFIIYRLSEE